MAVLDFGSQYSQLIVRRIRELGYMAKLYSPDAFDSLEKPAALILSGGPRSVTPESGDFLDIDDIRGLGVPVLGICYGMQMLSAGTGGRVDRSEAGEYGPAEIAVNGGDTLFRDLPRELTVWMSHSDTVTDPPPSAAVLAENREGTPVALAWEDDVYGLQFHPEVSHTEQGTRILANFLDTIHEPPSFSMESFRDELVDEIRETVGERTVLCAVSGGVDSTVLSVLLREAEVDLRCVFVDTGLMRRDEPREVMEQFDRLDVPVQHVDASERFLDAIEGVADPEEKRRRIGDVFLDEFFRAAGDFDLLAQGTLYPDVIESASSGSDADTIKTHHNRVDRIMELQREGRVIEPLDELFKDEVRELGSTLGIPPKILHRHPFPGPGLAIRVPGEVTPRRLEILREADAIYIDALRESGWYDEIWQAFCVLLPVKTVGVKGDRRSHELAVSVRAVTSRDGMTADWGKLPHDLLGTISNRILNRVDGVNRVLYDISTKPPSSIEWE